MHDRKLPIAYPYAILIGLAVGILFALKTWLMYYYWDELQNFSYVRYAAVPIVNYTTWGLLMPLAYFFMRRFQIGPEQGLTGNLLAVGASLLMSFIHEAFSNFAFYGPMHLFGYEPFTNEVMQRISKMLPSAMTSRLVEYWILYAVVNGLAYQRKYRDKQIELAQVESKLSSAQLNALRLQLQPHFLFNTLHTISSLMEINVKDAQGIVSRLGHLLRAVLDKNKRNFLSLREELAFIQSYLDIEQVRFQDRLEITYDIDEKALNCQVPGFILQPLVENAIKHGLARQTSEGRIKVSARLVEERLLLSVADNGKGSSLPGSTLLTNGQGISNLSDRLRLLYGEDHRLDIITRRDKGFAVHIGLPCSPPAAGAADTGLNMRDS